MLLMKDEILSEDDIRWKSMLTKGHIAARNGTQY